MKSKHFASNKTAMTVQLTTLKAENFRTASERGKVAEINVFEMKGKLVIVCLFL